MQSNAIYGFKMLCNLISSWCTDTLLYLLSMCIQNLCLVEQNHREIWWIRAWPISLTNGMKSLSLFQKRELLLWWSEKYMSLVIYSILAFRQAWLQCTFQGCRYKETCLIVLWAQEIVVGGLYYLYVEVNLCQPASDSGVGL